MYGKLDLELEMGDLISGWNAMENAASVIRAGIRVPLDDWSARDVQAWIHAVGPFGDKSFVTRVSSRDDCRCARAVLELGNRMKLQ